MNEVAKIQKSTLFLIEDSEFNLFKSKEDMKIYLNVLKDLAEQIISAVPVAVSVAAWPPNDMFLSPLEPKSPARKLYAVLADIFPAAGFSLGVLTTLEVENHEPYDTTALRADGRFRVFTVH